MLPPLFAEAARRARDAGFDGVELHYAHAYTMASFLSRLNTRPDGYGGAREHRVRLPLEVLAAVRSRVGADYVVGIRYLGDEVVAGGSDLDDAIWFGVRFAEAGVDYLSVSKGGRFEDAKQPKVGEAVYPYTGASGYECMPTVLSDARGPFGRNVPLAAAIRRAIREAGCSTPVVTSGGIATFEQAERILERGEADFVAAARQTLADPDWFRKIRLGHGDACGAASSRTTARASTSATSRSPASSGTGSSIPPTRRSGSPPTASGASARRRGRRPREAGASRCRRGPRSYGALGREVCHPRQRLRVQPFLLSARTRLPAGRSSCGVPGSSRTEDGSCPRAAGRRSVETSRCTSAISPGLKLENSLEFVLILRLMFSRIGNSLA